MKSSKYLYSFLESLAIPLSKVCVVVSVRHIMEGSTSNDETCSGRSTPLSCSDISVSATRDSSPSGLDLRKWETVTSKFLPKLVIDDDLDTKSALNRNLSYAAHVPDQLGMPEGDIIDMLAPLPPPYISDLIDYSLNSSSQLGLNYHLSNYSLTPDYSRGEEWTDKLLNESVPKMSQFKKWAMRSRSTRMLTRDEYGFNKESYMLSVYRDPFPLVIDENVLEKIKITSPDNILAPAGFWEELSLVKQLAKGTLHFISLVLPHKEWVEKEIGKGVTASKIIER